MKTIYWRQFLSAKNLNILRTKFLAKLHTLNTKCQELKKLSHFFLCVQVVKLSMSIQLSLMDKYNVSFGFLPGSNSSGTFLNACHQI